ncbi:MAG: type IV secretion system DNA-binding domain-containing protein [Actinomycetota bacterium]|nr:type IV secretion system DNA-binding domain-containing protein [Actinomycetota bacterium]
MVGSERALGIRVLGDTEVGPRRAVALAVEDGRFHTHVVGATGSGKSTLLANMALADIRAGRGVVLIDPKGDLVDDLLARLPEQALRRLVLIDPKETEAPPALNVLEGEPAEVAVDHVVSVFARIFSAWWGPRTEDVLRSACATLRRLPGATLADVPLLLTDRRFRAPLVSGLSERSGLKGFWDAYDALSPAGQAQVIGPIMNKLRAVLARRFARDLFGSARSSFDMKAVLSGGVLLARLPKGTLGEDTARLVGALLVASVWQAATARADDPVRPDATLYVDECQNFLALPTAIDDVLAEARGYHLSVVLAHQHLAQLSKDLFEAASANARNKVYFCVSPEDARVLARHTEPYLKPYDLSHLDAYQVACRLVVGGRDLHAFTLRTRPLPPAIGGREAEARQCARAHGRSRAERRHELLVRRRRHRRHKGGGGPDGVSDGVSPGGFETPGPPGPNHRHRASPTPASEDPDSWSNQ